MTNFKKNLKVILVANTSFTITNFREELIAELANRGHRVIVICPTESGANRALSKMNAQVIPINLSRKGLNPIRDIKYLLNLYKIFKKERPDVVLNYTIKPVIYSGLAAKLASISSINTFMTGLGYLFVSSDIRTKLIRVLVTFLYRLSLKFSKNIFFQNPDDLQVFLDRKITRIEKTHITNGSGVNLEKFQYDGSEKNKYSFAFVGRLLKDKGISEFIDAAKIIKKKYPYSSFWICGSIDNNPASYSSMDIEKWSSEGIINYTPHSNDVSAFLQDKEVFVLPSYREGTPRAILEAMSMQMPIITTNAPGCKETTKNNENGYLVDVQNVQELANAMEKFILNHSLVKEMGHKSFKMANEKYDVKKVNEFILNKIGV